MRICKLQSQPQPENPAPQPEKSRLLQELAAGGRREHIDSDVVRALLEMGADAGAGDLGLGGFMRNIVNVF